MEPFHWDESFITGLEDVDHQHKLLVDLINQFGRHIAQNETSLQEIETLFQQLFDYARYHFQEEECLMMDFEVDQRHIKPHQAEHRQFLDEVDALHRMLTPESSQSLLKFLTHWLAYHILGSDQNLSRQIAAIRTGTSPQAAFNLEEKKKSSATEPLLRALSGLFEQVSERNRDLLKLNETLEAKVAERTRELSEVNLHLEELARTDVLTGLPNRRHAMSQLGLLWDESRRNHAHLSCMMIDADGFKQINDNYGHDAGDVVLQQLALTLRDSARSDDIVCRLGGDEFLILCPDTALDGALILAEKIRAIVNELQVKAGAGNWKGSISVGVAERTPSMVSQDELIKQADESVYLSKQAGKNCARAVQKPRT